MRLPFGKRPAPAPKPESEAPPAGLRALKDGVLLARWFIIYELDREIARARRHERPLSVVVLHPAPSGVGDHALDQLVTIAAQAASSVARTTDLIGWLPNNRIIVIMPETGDVQAKAAAFRWQTEMFSRTWHLGGLRWNPSIIDPFRYDSGEALIEAMDATPLVEKDAA